MSHAAKNLEETSCCLFCKLKRLCFHLKSTLNIKCFRNKIKKKNSLNRNKITVLLHTH